MIKLDKGPNFNPFKIQNEENEENEENKIETKSESISSHSVDKDSRNVLIQNFK